MTVRERVRAIRGRLEPVYGARLRGVVVYGSESRGSATPESDIDVLVLVDGPVHLWSDVKAALQALYPLRVQWGRPISPKPVNATLYEESAWPLFVRAREEGVRG